MIEGSPPDGWAAAGGESAVPIAMLFSDWETVLTPGTPVIVSTFTSVLPIPRHIAYWSLTDESDVAGTTWNFPLSWLKVAIVIVPPATSSALLTTAVTTPRKGLGVWVLS